MWEKIAAHISEITGENFTVIEKTSVSGGCINQGYRLRDNQRSYFIKINRATDLPMFAAEAESLQQMRETQTIYTPKPICWNTLGNAAYLVLEWLDIKTISNNNQAWEKMGQQLAAMHRWQPPNSSKNGPFGWGINNTIGSTPQINTWTTNWAEFWTEHRIGYQLKLAKRKGGDFPQADRLLAKIPALLGNHDPQPSVVHGDLWGGNAAIMTDNTPVIFDPATYFADREVDLAMTELFGGFPPAFYQGYQKFWPLEPGFEQRKILYNLYHILNHFNLFGGSYESQANRAIEQLLR